MQEIGNLALVALLATLVEMFVEYFIKPLLPQAQPEPAPWYTIIPWTRYVAALAAVALALTYAVDVISLTIPTVAPSYIGMVLTGLIISRGSNYVHDLLGK